MGQPRVITIQSPQYRSSGQGKGGISCCCCKICPCIHLGFLKTLPGLLKLAEIILCSMTQSLMLKYGMSESATMGTSFTEFFTTVSSCFLMVGILLFCYIVSANSFNLIRSSILELVFNVVACFLYFSTSSHLSWAVYFYLTPKYYLMPAYSAYPAMTACYMLGMILGALHGVDAYFSYKHFRGQR